MKYLLGYDIGSSSVKASLLQASTGKIVASAFSPASEMKIDSPKPGFAEQDPEQWWIELQNATRKLKAACPFKPEEIIAIGISYQMHGLVCLDKNNKVLRPSIIWCDSRAVQAGEEAFQSIGSEFCLSHWLNSPGNFTASKLKWVKENQPEIFAQIKHFLLPGDFIAFKLTGHAATTVSGLSEGILWDFPEDRPAYELLDYYGIPRELLADRVPVFGEQGRVTEEAAGLLGIAIGVPVTYRAGDQPNNAWSLNCLQPGELAATAGTSGVIYGVTDKPLYDKKSRVNAFVHVNHQASAPRYGVLLCVNGTGILNSWLRKNFFGNQSYEDMNAAASGIPVGAEGLQFFPFGNGAERILENKDMGAALRGLQFNRHNSAHIARAAQEGIVFALHYGAEIMQEMGIALKTVRAGHTNMFLSPVFAETFANITGCTVELYNSDGSAGAARAAGYGAGYYKNTAESFRGMERIAVVEPSSTGQNRINEVYSDWKSELNQILK